MVDPYEENKRRWPSGPTGMNPMSVDTRMGNYRDLCIKRNSMNKEEADIPQRMKDMVEHVGWKRMKEYRVKSMSVLSDPV